MAMARWLAAVALILAGCGKAPVPSSQAAYVDSRACAGCHAAIAKTYRETAMAQAFYRATPAAMSAHGIIGRFEHAASGRTYSVFERNGRYFQSRNEKGRYELEREIHYVMGSGRHARTFISRTREGRLAELPLGWYSEKGGYLAMSPGYDRPDPLDFRRKISFDCMFCHNAYPAVAAGQDAPSQEPVFPAELPEGIDCQRCHGPGSLHIAAAGKGVIVNPAKLGPERAMEVCMQCHLETTSRSLPNSLVRFGRGAFSYRPGEPLGEFVLHFDQVGKPDKFEIVNSVYRLRQSRCFLESQGKMQCTTCHNPHDVPRGAAARVVYAKTCMSCHQSVALASHPKGDDCAGCHMPRRRTEDVVHAVMTDHKIVRRPPAGDLLAPKAEYAGPDYRGEVALYYPPAARDQETYLAVAQVVQKSNLKGGIPRLEALKSKEPGVLYALAQAYEAEGNLPLAEARYREAGFAPAMRKLGELLQRQGRSAEALPVLEKAGGDAGAQYALGVVYRDLGRGSEAIAAMERAIALDSDFSRAYNSLGGMLIEKGDRPRAESALREALRLQPDFAEAHSNLGQLLAAGGDYTQAEFHLRAAIRWKPDNFSAWVALGEVQSVGGEWAAAKKSYLEALRARPLSEAAWLGLGTAQAATGDLPAARTSLAKAASGKDAAIRQEAQELLGKMR
jgi:predicted CXXCH cytochrome family protein